MWLIANYQLRFSPPLDVRSVNSDTVRLTSEGRRVDGLVVPGENGRLAFFTPFAPLQEDTPYVFDADTTMPKGARLNRLNDRATRRGK